LEEIMENKLGSYILSLMATMKDLEEKQFVRDLAREELRRLNVNIDEFLRENEKDDSEEKENTEKTLLQEDKDGKK
tara:strand:+ start:1537 stop:1764 length:228 start_codon:yes stop_codon:yes gene_type:complete